MSRERSSTAATSPKSLETRSRRTSISATSTPLPQARIIATAAGADHRRYRASTQVGGVPRGVSSRHWSYGSDHRVEPHSGAAVALLRYASGAPRSIEDVVASAGTPVRPSARRAEGPAAERRSPRTARWHRHDDRADHERGRRSGRSRGRSRERRALHRYIRRTACRWPWPMSISRWCRCSLSAWPIPVPAARPPDAPRAPRRGRGSRRPGAARSRARRWRRGRRRLGGNGLRPTPEMVARASSIPSSIEPVSPMKILAGWKFHGRNPTQMPAVIADSSAACEASPNRLGLRTM